MAFVTKKVALAAAVVSLAALVACGDASKQNKAAYDACLSAAKANPRFANAKFDAFDNKMIGVSAGDEDLRVNIPYEVAGQKNTYQCIAQKQSDGSFKTVF
jgi:hypothetical protein